MALASQLTLFACGIFFLTGLLTGVWKYLSIWKSPASVAPRYVSVAHQTSLLYSFAALVLLKFLELSPYTETINFSKSRICFGARTSVRFYPANLQTKVCIPRNL